MQNRRAINLLIFANIISGIAQGISMISIPWYINSTLDMPELFGAVYATSCFFSLFWGLWSGTIIDQYDRVKVMMGYCSIAGIFVSSISLLGFLWGGLPPLFIMLVFAFNFLLYNIHYPTLYAFVQEITPPEKYGNMASKLEIQGQSATFMSGVLAAILFSGGNQIQLLSWKITLPFTITAFSMHEIFLFDGITYFIAVTIFSYIKYVRLTERIIDKGTIRQRIQTAYQFHLKHPYVLFFGLGSAAVFMSIITGSNQIAPLYIKNILNADASVYASSEMYFALGALTSGLIIKKITSTNNELNYILLFTSIAFMVYLMFILQSNMQVFLLGSMLVGFLNASIRIMRYSIFFQYIPNSIYGRIGSFINVFFTIIRLVVILLFTQAFFYKSILNAYIFNLLLLSMGMLMVFSTKKYFIKKSKAHLEEFT